MINNNYKYNSNTQKIVNDQQNKTNTYNILLVARRNCIGSLIFSTLLIISITLLIIGYLEVIVVKIDKNLLQEFWWYEKYIIANSNDGNSLYTSFYSYLVGWCSTAAAIIFLIFSIVFKILFHKSINIVIEKYKKYEDMIASKKLIMLSYVFGISAGSLILASLNQLIKRIRKDELL